MTHYDVIIFGESLAARIAAVLLAKSGRRVLTVGSPPVTPPGPAWIPVSLHLERLLELLGSRACLVSATPFQVLSGPVRLTLHGISALRDELRRELSTDSAQVENLLRELEDVGNRLETALWESGGLPLTGWASRWRFLFQRLRQGLSAGSLTRPLASRLQTGNSARTAQTLAALFSGLALCPIEQLSVAEGALLWRSFGDRRGISAGALNALLMHRFEQFHGEQAQWVDLQNVQTGDSRLREAVFRNGRRCSAGVVLLGSPDANALLPLECCAAEAAAPLAAPFEALVTNGAVSPLLAQVVIVDGAPPLRLTLVPDPAGGPCRLICRAAAPTSDTVCAQFEERLAALFPFATLRFEPPVGIPASQTERSTDRSRRLNAFPGAARALLAGKQMLHCCGELVLPGLGATGEIMVGVSVANHLLRQKRR